MAVSTIALSNIVWFYCYGTYQDFSVPVILLHLITDLPFASTELKIHHIFGMTIILFKYTYGINNYDDWHLTTGCYKTELSSFFYVFKYWLAEENAFTNNISKKTKKILQNINDALFYISFFKFRIYDYSLDMIFNKDSHCTSLFPQFQTCFDTRGFSCRKLCGNFKISI